MFQELYSFACEKTRNFDYVHQNKCLAIKIHSVLLRAFRDTTLYKSEIFIHQLVVTKKRKHTYI